MRPPERATTPPDARIARGGDAWARGSAAFGLFDPFGIAASIDGWGRLLDAAHELANVDAEMMDTLLETRASGPAPPPVGQAARAADRRPVRDHVVRERPPRSPRLG